MSNQEDLISALQAITWFQELEPALFDLLAGISTLQELDSGQELFREGERDSSLYIVLEGRVGIELHVPGKGRVRIYMDEPAPAQRRNDERPPSRRDDD